MMPIIYQVLVVVAVPALGVVGVGINRGLSVTVQAAPVYWSLSSLCRNQNVEAELFKAPTVRKMVTLRKSQCGSL